MYEKRGEGGREIETDRDRCTDKLIKRERRDMQR